MRRVGQAFERSVKHQRDPDQSDGKRHDRNRRAEQHLRKSLDLIFGLGLHLRRGAARDEDDAPRRLLRVRVDAGDEVFGRLPYYCASFVIVVRQLRLARRAGSLSCEYSPPSLRIRQK